MNGEEDDFYLERCLNCSSLFYYVCIFYLNFVVVSWFIFIFYVFLVFFLFCFICL